MVFGLLVLAPHSAWFAVLIFFYPMIGLRRFLYPHHAMSGFAIVCGELTGMARMPIIGWRRFSFYRHLVFDTG